MAILLRRAAGSPRCIERPYIRNVAETQIRGRLAGALAFDRNTSRSNRLLDASGHMKFARFSKVFFFFFFVNPLFTLIRRRKVRSRNIAEASMMTPCLQFKGAFIKRRRGGYGLGYRVWGFGARSPAPPGVVSVRHLAELAHHQGGGSMGRASRASREAPAPSSACGRGPVAHSGARRRRPPPDDPSHGPSAARSMNWKKGTDRQKLCRRDECFRPPWPPPRPAAEENARTRWAEAIGRENRPPARPPRNGKPAGATLPSGQRTRTPERSDRQGAADEKRRTRRIEPPRGMAENHARQHGWTMNFAQAASCFRCSTASRNSRGQASDRASHFEGSGDRSGQLADIATQGSSRWQGSMHFRWPSPPIIRPHHRGGGKPRRGSIEAIE